jgi:hypothetical protein
MVSRSPARVSVNMRLAVPRGRTTTTSKPAPGLARPSSGWCAGRPRRGRRALVGQRRRALARDRRGVGRARVRPAQRPLGRSHRQSAVSGCYPTPRRPGSRGSRLAWFKPALVADRARGTHSQFASSAGVCTTRGRGGAGVPIAACTTTLLLLRRANEIPQLAKRAVPAKCARAQRRPTEASGSWTTLIGLRAARCRIARKRPRRSLSGLALARLPRSR